MKPEMFSIVIPTHNRAGTLKRSLSHLLQMEGVERCEAIVVNDGSTDGTAEVLEELRRTYPEILRVLTIANGGPARARNRGVEAARGERILFVDDDVFPRPGMLQSHARMLDAGYAGSQGLLLWPPEIAESPLVRYIDSRGSQFAFDRVKDPACMEYRYVYTGNFAVHRAEVLRAGGFDEELFCRQTGFSAFEDTVLGFQLRRNGARLALNREAVADHSHVMTEEEYLRRERNVGYGIGLLNWKYPEIAQELGLTRKKYLAAPQMGLLRLINALPAAPRAAGYSFRMRLRHREAFYRGFLQFRRENALRRKAENL